MTVTTVSRVVRFACVAAALSLAPLAAKAEGPHVAPITELAGGPVAEIVAAPEVIEAIKAQNAKHAGLAQADIDALDKTWRAETGAAEKPMIDGVLANALSAYLAKVKEDSRGLYTEIFVMDNKGLNVGQSDVTSDYWQGDEAKFSETYGKGAGAVHISEVEQDESTQTFQSQLSMTVVDPATGEAIGAVTFGINVDLLMQ